jgi:voltage-gated potassium channel
MKFLSSQISYFFSERGARENISALLKYLLLLILVIARYSVLFHVIMLYAEGRYHSWITGVYWTLTVMTTLGFGDITFASDIGRFFSIVVLLSGIVLLPAISTAVERIRNCELKRHAWGLPIVATRSIQISL